MMQKTIYTIAAGVFGVVLPAIAAVECSGGTLMGGVCVPTDTGLSSVSIYQVLVAVLLWLTFIFASIAIIALVVCGLKYLFAIGDSAEAKQAKECVKFAIMGIIVAGGAFIVIKTIAQLLMGIPPIL